MWIAVKKLALQGEIRVASAVGCRPGAWGARKPNDVVVASSARKLYSLVQGLFYTQGLLVCASFLDLRGVCELFWDWSVKTKHHSRGLVAG